MKIDTTVQNGDDVQQRNSLWQLVGDWLSDLQPIIFSERYPYLW